MEKQWIPVAVAAKKHKVKSSQIHSVRISGIIPDWMKQEGTKWYVDDTDNSFLLFLKSKTKKAINAKMGHAKKKRKDALETNELNVLTMSQTERLQELSIQAELSKPITNLRLEQYKIETQKLKLEQQSGDLISRSMADFLFNSYITRLNRELLTYQNKLETEFDHVVADLIVRIREGEDISSTDIAKSMKQLIVNETEDIIKVVKKSQIDALKKWAEEEGVQI